MLIPTPPSHRASSVDAPRSQQADPAAAIRHPARLTALRRLALLDTPAEQAFDRLTRLAAKILHAPVALLSLVDGDRSFFKSSVGLPEHWASRREMPLSHSVCQHVVALNTPLVVNDARAHPLVSDNQAVAELRIVAYLGIPLVTSDGHALGTFAVIDTVPREWAPEDVTTLGDLAASAMTEIELRAETDKRLLVEQRLQLLESVVGNATTAVLIAEADPAEPSDPRIVFVNDAYTRLTGYAREEVVGKTHQTLNSSEPDRSQTDTIRTAMAARKPARLEFLTHRKDGFAFWVELNIVPIADLAGRYSHWVVVERDISEYKAAAAALRESEARGKTILESALDCIITFDSRERVLEFNPAAEKTFGYSHADVVGKPLADLIVPPAQCGSQTLELAQSLTAGTNAHPDERLEVTAVRADGTTFLAELAFTTILPEGPVYTAFLRDISGRKRAERLLAAQYACTRIIADSVVMDETIPKILRAVCENLDWTLGQMWQPDPKGGVLRCVAVWHDPAAAVAAFADLSRKTTLGPGKELPGRIWESREPTGVSDVATGADFSRAEEAARCGLHSAFAFPIIRGEGLLGVMEFFHENIVEPEGALLAMAVVVGSQLGQFFERVRAEEMLKEANQELEVRVARRTAELKQAEMDLRRTGGLLQAVADETTDAVFVKDRQGRYLLFNEAACRFVGKTEADVLGRDDADLFDPEGARLVMGRDRRVMETRQAETEEEVLTAAGVTRTYLSMKAPYRDAGGAIIGTIGISRDITDRKLAEEALHLRDRAIQAVTQGILITDPRLPDNLITYASPGFEQITGYAAAEAVGRNCRFLQGPDTDASTVALVREALREARPCAVEILNYRKDGTPFWNALSISPVQDAGGAVTHFVAVQADVTDRKRMEEGLRLFRALIDQTMDGIEVIDPETGRFLDVNEWACVAHGYTREEYLSLGVSDVDTHAASRSWGELIAEHRLTGARSFESLRRRKDGSTFPVEVNFNFIHLDRDFLVTVVRDVTERRQLEGQFRQAQKMEAVGRLAGGVAHDFNNLLQVITGYGELLLGTLRPDDPSLELVREMTRAGERAAGLTRQLLAFSRQSVLAPKVLVLNSVVVDLEKLLRRAIGEDIDLRTKLQPDLGRVKADPGQIEQVVLNLAVNARDAMPQGGKITIETREAELDEVYARLHPGVRAGTYVLMAVSDTGHGMTPEVQARIFEPFFTTKEKGTGLGLATVFGIVQQAGGHVAVYSEPGVGTTFKVYLPRVEESVSSAESRSGPQASPKGTETVLLVEDEDAVRSLARVVLQRAGYRVLEASDGREGLAVAARHEVPIHLLLTDVVMPVLGGRQLAEQLLVLHPEMKVLFQSGYTDDSVVRHGVFQERVHFLQKPYSPAALAMKIREVLDAPESSGALRTIPI